VQKGNGINTGCCYFVFAQFDGKAVHRRYNQCGQIGRTLGKSYFAKFVQKFPD
jgi:hypothetical protein